MQLTNTTQYKKKHNHQTREFDKAWQQVLRQKELNSKLEKKVKKFADQVMPRLHSVETLMAQNLCMLTKNLVVLYSRKSLNQWQRDELREWIIENIENLAFHPCTPLKEFADVKQQMCDIFEMIHPELPWREVNQFNEEVKEETETSTAKDREDGFIDDLFGFDDLDLVLNAEENAGFGFEDSLFEKLEAERLELEEKQRAENQNLDLLLKRSSINKMFRQLARKLHPDLAATEEERLERHHLMSELTEARDAKDIPRLFELYQQHFEESPMALLGDKADLETVTQLLKRQLDSLQRDQNKIIHSDPYAGALYMRLHKNTTKATERAIQEHVAMISEVTASLGHLVGEVTSLARLKPLLQERNEMRLFEYLHGDDFYSY